MSPTTLSENGGAALEKRPQAALDLQNLLLLRAVGLLIQISLPQQLRRRTLEMVMANRSSRFKQIPQTLQQPQQLAMTACNQSFGNSYRFRLL